MISIDFVYDGYSFSSIRRCDLKVINEWIIENDGDISSYSFVDPQILYRRFLEYYITEDEVYIKIVRNNNIAGIFKGRFEGKDEFFVWLYIIDEKLRKNGLGTKFLEVLISYFKDKRGIDNIRVGIAESNIAAISFWESCKFKIDRVSKGFFEGKNSKHEDMIIMRR